MRADLRRLVPVFVLAVVLQACSSSTLTPSPSPIVSVAASASPTATPTPTPAARWPLTGLVADDRAAIRRPPLNVRLPNDNLARPQYGLASADLVFEMIVEGGVTRYAAIYHSKDAKTIGPVRSYRFSDVGMTRMVNGVLVASGATIEEGAAATAAIKKGDLVSVDADRYDSPYYRVSFRPAPNNLFTSAQGARDTAKSAGAPASVDVPALHFLPTVDHLGTDGGFASATAATSLVVPFLRDPSTFTYDEGSRGYRRAQAGVRTVDGDGNAPVLARNVIVIWTDITTTNVKEDIFGSLGLDYRLSGTGKAAVFRDGKRLDGTWKRADGIAAFTFWSSAGEEILLDPGQSWIHFVYPDWVIASQP